MSLKQTIVIILFIILSGNINSQNNFRIYGFVKDIRTNENIKGALISSDGIGTAVSDSSGFYTFYSGPGTHKINCSFLGYESTDKEIDIFKDEKELFFYLTPVLLELEKVTITGERFKETQDYKTYELQSGELSRIPVFLESDALRSVQALPGVTSVHDFSSLIYLRGGNYDETLVILDNVTIYNPYHLGGIFGSINPDIVSREILYPSNYPVKYHGALSGVLSIFTKNGNKEKIKGIASIGLVSSKIFLEGPFLNGNFIFSARRTYPDLIFSLLSDGSFPYYFYDFNGKFSLPIDNTNLINFEGFYSRDVYKLFVDEDAVIIRKNDDLNWGNVVGQINYFHFFPKGFLKIDLNYSNSFFGGAASGISRLYDFTSVQDSLNNIENIFADNRMKDISLKSEAELNFQAQNLNLGLEFKRLSTKYYWDIKEKGISNSLNVKLVDIFYDFAPDKFNFNDFSDIVSGYISDKIQVTSFWDLMIGYRGIYVAKIHRYLNSPYIICNYKLNAEIELTSSYGKYFEYFYTKRELTRISYSSPYAIYFFPDDGSKIPTSDHFSLGLNIKKLLPGIRFEMEGYYKKRRLIFTSDELTKTFGFNDGYVIGIDILFKKEIDPVTGWVAYTLSRSVKKGSDYNYFSNYDRTHDLKILLNYNLSENWQINTFWIYASGMPFTPVIGKFISGVITDPIQLIYGRKNSDRFADYHRLDVGIIGNFIWFNKIIAKPYLQIMNIYNSSNPFNYKPSANDVSTADGAKRGSMIIPTLGITMEF